MKQSKKQVLKTKAQKTYATVVLFFLYRAMQALYKEDSRIREEVDSWPLGSILVMRVAKNGPSLCLRRTKAGLERVLDMDKPDIIIAFKSVESAFLVLTGQLGTARAYAQHRFVVWGDLYQVMSFVRCIDLVEAYLLPPKMAKRILRRVPKKQVSRWMVYYKTILGI